MITPELSRLREEIEDLDRKLIEVIAHRVRLARAVGEEKHAAGLPTLDSGREASVVRKAVELAREAGLDSDDEVRQIFSQLIALSRRAQARDE